MRDDGGIWIERLVPAEMRDRVFREALRETDRACRIRRRRAHGALPRLGVRLWRYLQITALTIECHRLARAARRERFPSVRPGGFPMQFQDFRFGVRTLVKAPGFSLVAILTLALGICGTAATFSVVDHVLLRPLPYPQPERVVDVNEWSHGKSAAVSPPNFMDWRNENVTFEALAGYQEDNLTLSTGDRPERVDAAAVAPELFDVLATRPLLGRTFTKDEARPGAAKVVALSHALWQRRFGADPGLVGRSITLEGEPYAVVGIMPERFDFPAAIQLWVPLVLRPSNLSANQRGAHYINAVGRLKDGVTAEQAQADLDRIEQGVARQYPDKLEGYSVHVEPYLDMMVGDVRRPLLVLMGAVMFVLLIACANVSNLLLARATTRTGEIAVRSALGAGRRRILAQLLAESLVLAVAGGAAGLLLTVWAVRVLTTLAPEDLPRGAAFSLNPAVLTFAVVVSLLTGIVFGLVPAIVASRSDVAGLLKDLRRGSGSAGRGRTIRNVLVGAEVALSLILLAGAGLAMRSFDRLLRVDPGFDPSHVLTFTIRLPEARYSTVASDETFFREFNARLPRAGITSSGAIFLAPLSPDGFGGSFTIVGRPSGQDEGNAQVRPVTRGYFETL
jgi:putative ABC transport system permease protein